MELFTDGTTFFAKTKYGEWAAKHAGFTWDKTQKLWVTTDWKLAHALAMQTSLTFEEKAPPVAERPLTHQEITLIHRALRILAGKCDEATTVDQLGFSKYDAPFGRSLAETATITEVQARAAKKMLKKYHRQIPEELYEALYPPVLATVAGAAHEGG